MEKVQRVNRNFSVDSSWILEPKNFQRHGHEAEPGIRKANRSESESKKQDLHATPLNPPPFGPPSIGAQGGQTIPKIFAGPPCASMLSSATSPCNPHVNPPLPTYGSWSDLGWSKERKLISKIIPESGTHNKSKARAGVII